MDLKILLQILSKYSPAEAIKLIEELRGLTKEANTLADKFIAFYDKIKGATND